MFYRNVIATILFFVVSCSISIFFPDISKVLGIVGGLSATSIQFMVPSNSISFYLICDYSDSLKDNKQERLFFDTWQHL